MYNNSTDTAPLRRVEVVGLSLPNLNKPDGTLSPVQPSVTSRFQASLERYAFYALMPYTLCNFQFPYQIYSDYITCKNINTRIE